MASEKKPSIYVDRGTIGSHDELDEYGVWVKSEPQDMSLTDIDSFEEFSEGVFEEASGTDDLSLEISGMDDLPDFGGTQEDDSLELPMEDSTDDIVMDDDLDLPDIGEVYEESLSGTETADFDALDDFPAEETAGFEEVAGFEETADFEESIEFEDTSDSLDLPEEQPLEASDEFTDDDSIEIEDQEFTEIVLEDLIGHQDAEPASDLPFPEEAVEDEAAVSDSYSVQIPDAGEAAAGQTITNDAASMTLSTQLLMKIADELSSIRSELSTLKRDFSSVVTAPSSPPVRVMETEDDEKIALTGDELSTILSTEPEAEEKEGSFFDKEEDDEKIALTGDELSTIISSEPEALAEDEASFFEEEEDEKIALTGDELSNILNTADFTEEAGSDATMELSEEIELSEEVDIQETEIAAEDFALAEAEVEADEIEADVGLLEEQDSSLELIDLDTEFTPVDMESSLEEADLEELELEYTRGELQIEEEELPEIEIGIPGEETEEQPAGFDMASDDILDISDSFELTESAESIDTSLEESIEESLDDSILDDSIEADASGYLEPLDEPVESADFEIPLEEIIEEEETNLVSLDDEPFPDFAIDETEELNEIRESGGEPICYAPDTEDADYLTDDPLSEDPLSIEETIDLSEAVIDEPDLSSELQDNPIEEPSLEDISIDLDLEEDISIPEDILEENTAGLESELGVFDEEIELSMELSEDISDSVLIEEDPHTPFETEISEDDEMSELSSVRVFSPVSSEDGGDLSLIPEGFVVDASESDSVEFDSMESDAAELVSTDFPDFPEDDSTSTEELETEEPETEELELELDSPELDAEDDDTISMDDIDDFITETEETVEEIAEIQDEPLPDEVSEALPAADEKAPAEKPEEIPSHLKKELKTVLSYMDQLLESLPDDKIEEFAKSEYYDTYKKLFKELGLV